MARSENPFEVLGIAPTTDASRVRRAYFAAVQRHPPHADADAFRRVRAAYELLSTSSGRSAAMVLAPVDIASEASPLRRRFDDALAQAAAVTAESSRMRETVRRFVHEISRLSWADAARLAGEDDPCE